MNLFESSLRIEGQVEGRGLLVVLGQLLVSGSLDFHGIVIVAGPLEVEAGGDLTVDGALWRVANHGALRLLGESRISYLQEAIDLVDQMIPEFLPRRILRINQREIL